MNSADTLLLFGATGDLVRRMLLPSLCALDTEQLLPKSLLIVGTARSDMSDSEYRNLAREAVEKFLSADRRGGAWLTSSTAFTTRPTTRQRLKASRSWPSRSAPKHRLAIFLSTAPSVFETTTAGLNLAHRKAACSSG